MRNDVNAESQKSENSEKWQLAKWEQFLLPLQQNGKSTPVDRPVQQVKMSVNQENGRGKNAKESEIYEMDFYLPRSYAASRREQRFRNGSSMYY